MSCGRHHETPCREVLEDVYLYLDRECDQHSTEKIRKHLEECRPCLQEFGIEKEVKALVARCCGSELAPDTLRQRLKATLRQVVVTDLTEPGGLGLTRVEITTVDVEVREK